MLRAKANGDEAVIRPVTPQPVVNYDSSAMPRHYMSESNGLITFIEAQAHWAAHGGTSRLFDMSSLVDMSRLVDVAASSMWQPRQSEQPPRHRHGALSRKSGFKGRIGAWGIDQFSLNSRADSKVSSIQVPSSTSALTKMLPPLLQAMVSSLAPSSIRLPRFCASLLRASVRVTRLRGASARDATRNFVKKKMLPVELRPRPKLEKPTDRRRLRATWSRRCSPLVSSAIGKRRV